MVRSYSDLLQAWFNSEVEANQAEEQYTNNQKEFSKWEEEKDKQVKEIEKKRDEELKVCAEKLNEISYKIENLVKEKERLIKERDNIRADIQHINTEAKYQINDILREKFEGKYNCNCQKDNSCKTQTTTPSNDEMHISIKTFDSSKDKDWQTVIDETGKRADIEKKMKELRSERVENNELRKLLRNLDILK